MPEFYDREVSFTLERSEGGDGLTLCGYAAVFNSPTRIRGEVPREFDEVIAPGAFAKTIREGKPVLMFDHGKHPLIGTLPIGQITSAREDARGLYIEARLHDNWLTQPVRDAIASEAISGMSFRFSVPKGKETWDRSGPMPLRTLQEVRCVELGPVVFPAYADTSVMVRGLVRADEDAAVALVRAVRDMDTEQEVSVVDQIKQMIAALLSDEVAELQADPDATGSIQALLMVLADLDWFETIDAIEDADATEDDAEGMNSANPYGTSDRAAAVRTLFSKPPATEPQTHSVDPGERARVLRSLILEGDCNAA